MRTDRMLAIAETIENMSDEAFRMDIFLNSCATAGCIAGHGVLRYRDEEGIKLKFDEEYPASNPDIFHQGKEIDWTHGGMLVFDLTYEEAVDLFAPPGRLAEFTREEAIRCLRETAATREVPDWWLKAHQD